LDATNKSEKRPMVGSIGECGIGGVDLDQTS
jgi:hypothetical protein